MASGMSCPDEGYFQCRRSGPGLGFLGTVDHPSHVHGLVQANLASVALGDRVGGDDAHPAMGCQGEVAEQEVGAEVGAASFGPANPLDQGLAKVFAYSPSEPLAAQERWVAHDRVEAAVAHDFGELQRPMKRTDGFGSGALEPGGKFGAEGAF